MIQRSLSLGLVALLWIFSLHAAESANSYNKRFYIGLLAGYGSTTWHQLISNDVTVSTPAAVTEGGAVTGFQAGYQVNSSFAIQTQFMDFPTPQITLPPWVYPPYDDGGIYTIYSKTSVWSLIAKFMIPLNDQASWRAFSDLGIAYVQRGDLVAATNQVTSPTFGGGMNWIIGPRVMLELAFDYTAGYGKSDSTPIADYIPFTYSVTEKISYIF